MNNDIEHTLTKQIVHTTSLFSVDEQFDDERFMRVRIAAMHTGINRNNSRFSLDTIKNAKNTFANIPILAEVKETIDENGNKCLDYTSHSMHIEEDAFDSENERTIYDEKVVGIVPETNNFELVLDDETGNYYVWVDALLYRDYGNYVCDILESKGGKTDVSSEIICDEVSVSAKDKCLNVLSMRMNGITLLGEAVRPGMAKAHAAMFSLDDDNKHSQLVRIMQELKESLDNYTNMKHNSKEGGNCMTKFEELLEQYGKTVEDIQFDYEDLTDEELTAKFEGLFGGTDSPEQSNGIKANNDIKNPKTVRQYAVTLNDGSVKNFEVSFDEIQSALYSLVNATYSEADNDYYYVTVYESSLVMHGLYTGRAYRQSYKVEDGNYSLSGDRVRVFANWLTKEEEQAITDMRSNYSAVTEKLAKYEDEPKKLEVLNSDEYSKIADLAEFAELKKQENHFDMSIEDVTKKCDEILLTYAKSGSLTFASEDSKPISKKRFSDFSKKNVTKSRYGNLFKDSK